MSGAAKLSQDMATLINNRQGSDIQFKVGGGITSIIQDNGDIIYDESVIMTLYAHSVILRCRSRYFATMLDEEKNWKESVKGVIYKPNISPSTFQDVLYYIYTGNVRAKNSENIVELITAADEMELEELSLECQEELIRTIKSIFSGENGSYYGEESLGETLEGLTKQHIPIDVAIRTHIIPALNLASNHSLSHLSQELLSIILPNIFVIIDSPGSYTTFVNNISYEALSEIITSYNLAMTERSVWDLTLNWACHQTNLSKAAVEACLANLENGDESDSMKSSDGAIISRTQLNQLKTTLAPLLPAVRFGLLDPDDYAQIINVLSYFLPRHRLCDLNRYFINTNYTGELDVPRMERLEPKVRSKIMVKFTAWKFLRKSIFETGVIADCPSFKNLKFDLLFRASEHNFSANVFHQYCDRKGPTLTIVQSADGHLFGGVNFVHWSTNDSYSWSPYNFLFVLPDGHHRKNALIFKNSKETGYSSYNDIEYGPCFAADLYIANSANLYKRSHSALPHCYDGDKASNTVLAGTEYFNVSNYEVFAISKE